MMSGGAIDRWERCAIAMERQFFVCLEEQRALRVPDRIDQMICPLLAILFPQGVKVSNGALRLELSLSAHSFSLLAEGRAQTLDQRVQRKVLQLWQQEQQGTRVEAFHLTITPPLALNPELITPRFFHLTGVNAWEKYVLLNTFKHSMSAQLDDRVRQLIMHALKEADQNEEGVKELLRALWEAHPERMACLLVQEPDALTPSFFRRFGALFLLKGPTFCHQLSFWKQCGELPLLFSLFLVAMFRCREEEKRTLLAVLEESEEENGLYHLIAILLTTASPYLLRQTIREMVRVSVDTQGEEPHVELALFLHLVVFGSSDYSQAWWQQFFQSSSLPKTSAVYSWWVSLRPPGSQEVVAEYHLDAESCAERCVSHQEMLNGWIEFVRIFLEQSVDHSGLYGFWREGLARLRKELLFYSLQESFFEVTFSHERGNWQQLLNIFKSFFKNRELNFWQDILLLVHNTPPQLASLAWQLTALMRRYPFQKDLEDKLPAQLFACYQAIHSASSLKLMSLSKEEMAPWLLAAAASERRSLYSERDFQTVSDAAFRRLPELSSSLRVLKICAHCPEQLWIELLNRTQEWPEMPEEEKVHWWTRFWSNPFLKVDPSYARPLVQFVNRFQKDAMDALGLERDQDSPLLPLVLLSWARNPEQLKKEELPKEALQKIFIHVCRMLGVRSYQADHPKMVALIQKNGLGVTHPIEFSPRSMVTFLRYLDFATFPVATVRQVIFSLPLPEKKEAMEILMRYLGSLFVAAIPTGRQLEQWITFFLAFKEECLKSPYLIVGMRRKESKEREELAALSFTFQELIEVALQPFQQLLEESPFSPFTWRVAAEEMGLTLLVEEERLLIEYQERNEPHRLPAFEIL